MSAQRFNAERVEQLAKVAPLVPVSVIARAAGVSRQRLYALVDAGYVRWQVVEGFGLVEVESVLRYYGRN